MGNASSSSSTSSCFDDPLASTLSWAEKHNCPSLVINHQCHGTTADIINTASTLSLMQLSNNDSNDGTGDDDNDNNNNDKRTKPENTNFTLEQEQQQEHEQQQQGPDHHDKQTTVRMTDIPALTDCVSSSSSNASTSGNTNSNTNGILHHSTAAVTATSAAAESMNINTNAATAATTTTTTIIGDENTFHALLDRSESNSSSDLQERGLSIMNGMGIGGIGGIGGGSIEQESCGRSGYARRNNHHSGGDTTAFSTLSNNLSFIWRAAASGSFERDARIDLGTISRGSSGLRQGFDELCDKEESSCTRE